MLQIKESVLNTILGIYFLMIMKMLLLWRRIDNLPPLEGHEEKYPTISSGHYQYVLKKKKGLKIFNSNKLLTRLTILLAQIKVENNSDKLENKIREIVSFISIITFML